MCVCEREGGVGGRERREIVWALGSGWEGYRGRAADGARGWRAGRGLTEQTSLAEDATTGREENMWETFLEFLVAPSSACPDSQ